ncbi:hypothetical protein [Hamadaea tsunoensis]|uniref:hypothetical protein n=1 Tax=Hamadaea tsunoensis TaxID=53368 RepID=UPI0004027D6F|nr:hypothetical protein [Hamadaea tsunoensis]
MIKKLALVVAAVALVGSAAAPAYADAPAGLDAAKKLVTARIDGRLATLRADGALIRDAAHLTAAHKSTLQAQLDKDTAGLTALKAKVAGETAADALKADAQSMVNDYRVYILFGPQVRLTAAADVEAATDARLKTVADKLQQAIDAAKAKGTDTSAAEAKLADLRTQIDAAAASYAGAADAFLAVQPGPDAAAIKSAKDTARGKLRDARTHLKAGVADAKAIRDLLKK